jgi:O-antigen/teichoic acid export membrane protein
MWAFWQRLSGKVRADRRLSGVLHGGASALLSRAFSLLAGAVSLPLTVRYLGPERYGIWVTVSTTVVMLSVMDLGIASSLTNRISQAYAAGDEAAAQRFYASAFWISLAISAFLALAAWLVWPRIDWPPLFHLTDSAAALEASRCVMVALGFFLLSLPLNLINRVLSGYQQTQITNYFNLLSSLLGLLAIVAVIALRGSLLQLMIVYSTTLLAGTMVLNLWVNLRSKPWLLPVPWALSRTTMRQLLDGGIGFFVLQLAGLVVFNSDNIVITHFAGAAEVAPYSVTWRLAGYAALLQTAVFPSLWPAYAEAYARQDYSWVRRTFWNAVRLAMGATAAAVLVIALFGRTLIRWYVGAAVVPSQPLLLAICAWTLMSAGMDLEACLLAAVNRVKWQGILSVIAAGVNLGLSIFLVKRIGSLGVILGTIASYVLVLAGPQTFIVWRALYRPPLPETTNGHAHPETLQQQPAGSA